MLTAAEQEAQVKQHINAGRLRDAADLCGDLNQQFPDYDNGWHTASVLALLLQETTLATRAIDRALQLSPGNPDWLFQRVACLVAAGDADAARATASKLQDHVFSTIEGATTFAKLCGRIGLHELAARHHSRAIDLDPGNGIHYFNLATTFQFLGRLSAADDAVARCLELLPKNAGAHLFRAQLTTKTETDNNIDALKSVHASSSDKPAMRCKICYALAKELDDLDRTEEAFEFLAEGASLRRSALDYDAENDINVIQKVREVYTAEKFGGRGDGFVNAEPIFIVGLPRSGIGIVRRILGAHPVVQSVAEKGSFVLQLAKHCHAAAGDTVVSGVDMVPVSANVDFASLGEDYVAATRPGSGSAVHFVDAYMLNFLYAGPIHLALPKAKIVVVERDPMDLAFALFKHLFDRDCQYSFDLQELGRYIAAYRELIDHWQSIMPDVMHVVRFEELVESPRPVVEELLQYCSLSWRDECLNFYENPHSAIDDGTVQTRIETYRASIGKWQRYARQMEPVRKILETTPKGSAPF